MNEKVCVIGAGRIGLPISLVVADEGFEVIALDRDEELISSLRNKESPFYEPQMGELLDKHINSNMQLTSDLEKGLKSSDIIIITIGSGLTDENEPDMDNVWGLLRNLVEYNLKGKLLIFKTTLPMGTTNKIKDFIEEKTDLIGDEDFFMSFCPERIVEGKAIEELRTLPNIIGGIGRNSTEKTSKFMKNFGGNIIEFQNPTAAEFVKLIDNTYRITKFGYSNDLAYIAEVYDLDVFDIIDAANEGYDRNQVPYPSCGVTGYCLTKDPHYLENSFKGISESRGFSSVWYYARKSTDHREKYSYQQIKKVLEKQKIDLNEANVLVCGITYKENVDDIRMSHGSNLADKLYEDGANISVWDPWVDDKTLNYDLYRKPNKAFMDKDIAIFTVPHTQFQEVASNGKIKNYIEKMENKVIFDGWGLFRDVDFNNPIIYFGTGLSNINYE
ncbi:MAG: nucleotide sugar dehydrogenase [archaeon]